MLIGFELKLMADEFPQEMNADAEGIDLIKRLIDWIGAGAMVTDYVSLR